MLGTDFEPENPWYISTLSHLGSWWFFEPKGGNPRKSWFLVSFFCQVIWLWVVHNVPKYCVPLSCNTRRYRQLSILNDTSTLRRLSITTFPFGPNRDGWDGLLKKPAFVAGSPDHSPACARDTIESWDLDVLDLDTEGQAKVHQVRRAWEKGTEEVVRVWGVSPHFQAHTLLSPHHPLVPYKNWLI